ncbi:MAG TPA: cation:proton antiporter [Candidatus Acidoferrales bacterium]|nr:cation:proton antiporter [Candidatus Acidoferrales bacterium]
MNLTAFFALLGGLLVLAFAANRLFDRTRVPDVVVLMVAGLILGPGFGLVDPAELHGITRAFGTLAIILILFEGGLELNIRDTLRHSPGGLLFAFLTYVVSFGVTALVAWRSLGLPAASALLVGAVLGCTSIAIIMPVLDQIQVRDPVKVTLLLEASLGEVFAVLTVGILIDQMERGGPVLGGLIREFMSEIAVALMLTLGAAWLWARLLPKLSRQPFWQVLTFSAVLLLYAATQAAGGSGLIAVFGFGLGLANFSRVGPRLAEATFGVEAPPDEPHLQILAFHSELAFLVRTFFFVLIGLVVDFAGLIRYVLPAVGILAALYIARWVAVQSSRWAWQGITAPERETILWMLPRGLITAVLAIQVFEARGEEFSFLPALAFGVILLTSLVVVFGSIRARRATEAAAAHASGSAS